jgi:hypothetical protein
MVSALADAAAAMRLAEERRIMRDVLEQQKSVSK